MAFAAVFIAEGPSKCAVYPYLQSKDQRDPAGATATFTTARAHVELRGNPQTIAIFGRFPNGTILRDIYISYRLFGLNFYDLLSDQWNENDPSANIQLIQVLPMQEFTNITRIGSTKYILWVNFTGERVEQVALILELDHPTAPLGVKFSWKVIGSNQNMFADRPHPGVIGLSSIYEFKGAMFDQLDPSLLSCAPLPGNYICLGRELNSTLRWDQNQISWNLHTKSAAFSADLPQNFILEGSPSGANSLAAVLRGKLFAAELGPLETLSVTISGTTTTLPPGWRQGISFLFENLFANVTREIYWDPSLNLELLFDPLTGPSTGPGPAEGGASAGEAPGAVPLAIAIAVPLALFALILFMLLVLMIPALRRKLFTFEGAMHDAKKKVQQNQNQNQNQNPNPTPNPNGPPNRPPPPPPPPHAAAQGALAAPVPPPSPIVARGSPKNTQWKRAAPDKQIHNMWAI